MTSKHKEAILKEIKKLCPRLRKEEIRDLAEASSWDLNLVKSRLAEAIGNIPEEERLEIKKEANDTETPERPSRRNADTETPERPSRRSRRSAALAPPRYCDVDDDDENPAEDEDFGIEDGDEEFRVEDEDLGVEEEDDNGHLDEDLEVEEPPSKRAPSNKAALTEGLSDRAAKRASLKRGRRAGGDEDERAPTRTSKGLFSQEVVEEREIALRNLCQKFPQSDLILLQDVLDENDWEVPKAEEAFIQGGKSNEVYVEQEEDKGSSSDGDSDEESLYSEEEEENADLDDLEEDLDNSDGD